MSKMEEIIAEVRDLIGWLMKFTFQTIKKKKIPTC